MSTKCNHVLGGFIQTTWSKTLGSEMQMLNATKDGIEVIGQQIHCIDERAMKCSSLGFKCIDLSVQYSAAFEDCNC